MSDIKNTFGKLKYQSYDELSFEDKAILSMAFSSHYSDVEIRYMLEELNTPKGLLSCVQRPGGTFEEQLQRIHDNILNKLKKGQ